MKLVDSHAHLDDPSFAGEVEQVLDRAREGGVETVLTVGCLGADSATADRVLGILDRYEDVWGAFGVHPHDARFLDDRLENRLEQLLAHPKVVALGEIGLDYFYDHSPRDVQVEAFQRQIALARRLGKPIIVHSRDAEERTSEILSDAYSNVDGGRSGVLHCFSGSAGFARLGIELGFFIAFGGVVTFKKADAARENLAQVPIERLLLETDAPYLAPVPFRGKRNEPGHLPLIAGEIARVLGRPVEEVAEATTGNFGRLFAI